MTGYQNTVDDYSRAVGDVDNTSVREVPLQSVVERDVDQDETE